MTTSTCTVLLHFSRSSVGLQLHERTTLAAVANQIARLKGGSYGGCYTNNHRPSGTVYYVPDETLTVDEAKILGIEGPDDLYGGVVPDRFVMTKAITHPLIGRDAKRPSHWSDVFSEQVKKAVLPGYTAFAINDARTAARRLLRVGAIRLKPPLAAGGKGQAVARCMDSVDAVLGDTASDEIAQHGIVVELALQSGRTVSVGQITVDDAMCSYYGVQRQVTDNQGCQVYGGSDIVCLRGDWRALKELLLDPETTSCIDCAVTYDQAMQAYPGFFSSRRNYDVGQGIDFAGMRRSGVFEASWRAGGASTAELGALATLCADPSLRLVKASAVKQFGHGHRPPPGAMVHFDGQDPEEGPILRYTILG